MLFNQTSISKHKARCVPGNPGRSKGVTKLLGNPFGKKDCSFLDPTFYSDVFDKMHQDEIKAEISTDPELTYIGNYQYMKLKNNRTNNTAPSDGARKTMRTLARLKINTNKVLEKKMGRKFLLSEMFSVLMWETVHGVIKKMIYKSDGDKTHLKRGIATLLRVSIKFACDSLISFYTMYRPEADVHEKEVLRKT